MPYFPDTSVLGPGAVTGVLSGAIALSFSGPAQSASTDTATGIGTVFMSGGANIQNAGVQVGYAGYINFAGTALASVAIATNTATITYNGGGGASLLVQDEGLNTQAVQLMNFVGTGVTATVSPANTATITINAGAASAGGLDRSVQFNNATALSGADKVDISTDGFLTLNSVASGAATPNTPSANNLVIFSRVKAGRNLLSYEGPSGIDGPYQPMLGMNRVYFVQPLENTAVMSYVGAASGVLTGALTARAVVATPFSATLRHVEVGPANVIAGSASAGGWAYPQPSFLFGSVPGAGGFYNVFRLIMASTSSIATTRFFCGYMTATTNPVLPSGGIDSAGYANAFGVIKNLTGTNYSFFHSGSNGTQVQVDSGITYNVGDVLEIRFFAKPSATQVNMSLEVMCVGGSGTVGAGPYAEYATTGNLQSLPTNTTLMLPRFFVQSSGATGPRMGIISIYGEGDT